MADTTPAHDADVTRLLQELRSGNSHAEAELIPIVYHELRRLARSRLLRERADHTLQTTALVHEAYLKLSSGKDPAWVNRAHFLAVASEAMKQILVDHARKRLSAKRSGERVDLTEAMAVSDQALERVLIVNEVLERLAKEDPRQAQVVVLRFFGGLDYGEIGAALDINERTAKRDWKHAQAWLYGALNSGK